MRKNEKKNITNCQTSLTTNTTIISVEGGFDNPTPIANYSTTADLYVMKTKLDTALSHFGNEYDPDKYIRIIAEATAYWHYCYNRNPINVNKYQSDFVKTFYKSLRDLDCSEFGDNYSKSNKISFKVTYSNNDEGYYMFLTEKIFNFIIATVNEVVVNTLTDGSCVENLRDLSAFLDQAIPAWEYMKKSPSVFVPVSI
jgi:hypothetical protein